ncbi:MAG: ATP-dependent RNA helicase DDX42 [Bacillariaceae sp.]|jgi:ATP-dependent RNA helicase DDX42
MGWFDGDESDDDDEEDQRIRQKESLTFKAATNNNDDDDEEDPLDAYMKTLQDNHKPTNKTPNDDDNNFTNTNTGTATAASKSGGRLDVECDDEATSHWVNNNSNLDNNNIKSTNNVTSTTLQQGESDKQQTTAFHAMQSTFHKASDQQQQQDGSSTMNTKDHRDVNIQLQQVKHDEMGYKAFEKNYLLPMSIESNGGHNNEINTNNVNDNTNTRNTSEGHKWRKENQVTCHPPLDPIYDFAELRDILPEEVLTWNAIKNLTKPTLVQSQTLGVALCGKDAIVTATTGSGKTLSYLFPIVSHLMANHCSASTSRSADNSSSRALVLVPTRELALQVEQIAKSMFAKLPLTALAIVGGHMGRYQLSQKLQSTKPHCVIATPGRLLDVLNSQQKLKQAWLLPNITLLIMDEADKMIQMGFANQVTQVLQNLRPDRQSLLVSATFDSRLQRRCQEWMHDPCRISVGKTGESSKHVIQHAICLPNSQAKIDFLKESLPAFVGVGRTLVFCSTRQGVEDVAKELRPVLPVETLHGDRHLTDRKASLKAFTKGDIKVLIATDVAGRGLDIPQVSTVINFDAPKNWNTHVHRIGRAGRMSAKDDQQEGSAYTLMLPSNVDFAIAMIREYKREERPIPAEIQKLANHQTKKRDHGSSSKGYYGHEAPIKKGR